MPKLFTTNLKDNLEKFLKEDKINVIVVEEERKYVTLRCERIEGDILLELNEERNPQKILGCREYREKDGKCTYWGSCKYLKWKDLKYFKD